MSESVSFIRQERLRSDRYLLVILLAHVPVVGLVVPLEFDTGAFSMIASLLLGVLATAGYFAMRGTRACSAFFAICLMAFSAVMIQAQMGRVEMHFHIFAALALVIIYKDWMPVVAGAGFIAIHHLLLTALQQAGASLGEMPVILFNHGATYGMALLHAAFVVFESAILVFFALRMAAERHQAFQLIELIRDFGANKDLGGRLSSTGDKLTASHFNDMMDQFGELIGRVKALSGNLRQSTDALIEVSDHTGSIVEDQQRQTDQAAAATNQMTSTVHEVAQNAQAASESAGHASQASEDGRRNVEHAVQLTGSTNTALGDSALMVNELADKVKAIGNFISSINEISEQTNLLALNAAIEAARAGEHGRGFAVVADEVRNLSRRTQEFTGEIRSTIDDLGSVSEATVAAIEMGQTRSRETTLAIQQTDEAIVRIEEAIAAVSDMNHQIASAAEEQAAASSEINESVQRMADKNSEVVQEADRTRAMATQLEQIIVEVDGLVREYRGL